MATFSRSSGPGSSSDPFDVIRYAAGLLLCIGTIISVALWLSGITTKGLLLVGALWSVYGLIHAVLDGVLDPLIELVTDILQNIGLTPFRQGYSHIEAMVARGETESAAAAYAQRAGDGDAQAAARRAMLLSGPLHLPAQARIELEEFREQHALRPVDDIRVGLALARVYEDALDSPGSAMREIRRLLDLYPGVRGLRHIRQSLAALKAERFGGPQ